MSRDKLLTIRIEEEKRLAFNNWCEARDYSYSKFLYKVIEGCLSGRIDESIFSGEPVDNDLAVCLSERMEHIEQLVSDSAINLKVDDSVDEYLANNLDKRIEESVIKKLDDRLDNKLNEAIADKIQNSEYLDNKLNEAIASIEQDAVPNNVPSIEEISTALSTVPSMVEEKVRSAIADLKKEFQPPLDPSVQIQQLVQDGEFIDAVAQRLGKTTGYAPIEASRSEIAPQVKK